MFQAICVRTFGLSAYFISSSTALDVALLSKKMSACSIASLRVVPCLTKSSTYCSWSAFILLRCSSNLTANASARYKSLICRSIISHAMRPNLANCPSTATPSSLKSSSVLSVSPLKRKSRVTSSNSANGVLRT